jgi:integrase
MATVKLTKTVVDAVAPAERDIYLWDTALPRFGLRVTPMGARIYLIQYRAKGPPGQPAKTRRITIGQHGQPWTVDKARDEAKRLLAAVDLGRDPFAVREDEREARRLTGEAATLQAEQVKLRQRDNFQAVTERYIEACLRANRSGGETARLLRHGPVPAWRDRHIGEVRRVDVADLMDAIKQRSPAVARSTYDALRGLFGWCTERELIVVSPCANLTAPPRPEARDRVLADDELKIIWQASDGLGLIFGSVIKLLMLTGQRRAEVAGMAWAELDLEAATWRIPKERSKNGKAHEIDLSPRALELIKAMPRSGPNVFPARGEGAVRGFSATKRKLDALIAAGASGNGDPAVPAWRLHDLRRTAATGMAALGCAPHIVERVLNHISGTQSGLVGVYQRHEYRAERLAAITAWGAHVDAVITGRGHGENVVALRA